MKKFLKYFVNRVWIAVWSHIFAKTHLIGIMKRKLFLILAIVCTGTLNAQNDNIHRQSTEYKWPEDPLVLKKLETWQDQKFGMIIHWGLYAVPGIIESWALCSEDWISRPDSMTYCQFKEWYWGLRDQFNPVNFNPEQWAKAGKDAGMRYLVFTTKHHDGFSMFDSKTTDFDIASGPFSSNARADVAKHVFDAFRKEGFMIGAYFSKPDWHSEYYWWPKYSTADRNNNYDIRKYPERWNNFKTFTFDQLQELMHNYGSIDILWLDGGWVRPLETVNEEVRSWGARIPEWSQDINMPKIADMARKAQPGILIVDRTVHGPYENYQTPERRIPDTKLDHPWESCIPLGDNWGYVPNDPLKSSTEIIHQLIEVVAKGGSMLLGVGPKPDGTIDEPVLQKLKEIGDWMKIHSVAIYGSRTTAVYQHGNTFFTTNKDGSMNAFVKIPAGETLPEVVEWEGNIPEKGTQMKLLTIDKTVKWVVQGKKVKVYLPASLRKGTGKYPALAFTFNH